QLDGGKGSVTFTGGASGYEGLSVLDDPAEVTARLVRDRVNDDIAQGLAIQRRAPDEDVRHDSDRFLLLRWGYDLQGAVKGAVALGFGPSATFGVEGKRLGAYAIVRRIPRDRGAASALQDLIDGWMLPTHFRQLEDLASGTWLIAEVDGSFALNLGAQ